MKGILSVAVVDECTFKLGSEPPGASLLAVQDLAKRWFPGCVNGAGKARQNR